MKDLKEYINDSDKITVDKLKELALSKADEGMGDGWIHFKSPVTINSIIFIGISDDGQKLLFNCDRARHQEIFTKFVSDEVVRLLYNELKKL